MIRSSARVLSALLALAVNLQAAERRSTSPDPPRAFSLRWITNSSSASNVVEVTGLPGPALEELRRANWKTAQWQRLLSVYAEQGDVMADIGLPPMSGSYRIHAKALCFEPQFPLEAGVKYRAIFRADQLPGKTASAVQPLIAVYHPPARRAGPSTVVAQVYPSAKILPENLLKFYLHFSAPMSRGQIYDHIHLRNEAGKDIELPFLEIDEELWNPEMTRLTLFIDPGRIKRGVRPLEEVGPALEAGKGYALVIDREWRDALGNPLKESFKKTFQVGPPDRTPPDPAHWKIQSPPSETRDALKVTFAEPMDRALAQRVIRVASAGGNLIAGETELADEERRWSFVPAEVWRRGSYKLVVQTTIEDLAGNNIGKAFEVDLLEGVQPRLTNSTVTLSFEVRSSRP